ncbi:MAG: hypothetical protein RIS09_1106 [Actinomycetota bacterium]
MAPENSLSAFLGAYECGCRHLELDVRDTKDGNLVVFHDATLRRMLNRSGFISQFTSEHVAQFRYKNGESIVHLKDLVEALPEDAFFNIDPKSDRAAGLLTRFVEARPELIPRTAIGTFSTKRITGIREAFPMLATAASRNEVLSIFARYLRGKPFDTKAKALQIPLNTYFQPHLRAEFADYVHNHGLQVHVWTVNSAETMQWLYQRGFDAVMTDKPSIAARYFSERNE